jgi:hypothetical protein
VCLATGGWFPGRTEREAHHRYCARSRPLDDRFHLIRAVCGVVGLQSGACFCMCVGPWLALPVVEHGGDQVVHLRSRVVSLMAALEQVVVGGFGVANMGDDRKADGVFVERLCGGTPADAAAVLAARVLGNWPFAPIPSKPSRLRGCKPKASKIPSRQLKLRHDSIQIDSECRRARDTFWDVQVPKTTALGDSSCAPLRPACVALRHRVRGGRSPRLPTEPCVRVRTRLLTQGVSTDSHQTSAVASCRSVWPVPFLQ